MLNVAYPFTGRWRAQNSPADHVPSHGTNRFATAHAIDFVPVDDSGRTAPVTIATLMRPEPAERFPGFGRAVLAPIGGTIIRVRADAPDHASYRGLPSVGYALTQWRRVGQGWPELAGNHVLIAGDGVIVALCHLQQASIAVQVGDTVDTGRPIGRCGNSGNSTEPHLHIQAFDGSDPVSARPVPIAFDGRLPRNGEIVTA